MHFCTSLNTYKRGNLMTNKTFSTSDLATAAFLHMRGLRLIKAGLENGKKFNFIFDDSEGKASSIAYEFINSECSRFDNHVRMLKKMIYN